MNTIEARLKALREGRMGDTELPSLSRQRRTIAGATVYGHAGLEGRADRARALRQQTMMVSAVEATASPFENLVFTNALLERGDKQLADIRGEAGFKFREDVEKSQISTLGAKVIGETFGGGGGSSTLADVKIFAMQSIGRIRKHLSEGAYKLLEDLIINDAWVFEKQVRRKPATSTEKQAAARAAERHRRQVLPQILCALDALAVHYELLKVEEYRAHWPGAFYGA